MTILPINNHIWVSASAGTGKTTILTNRVLQLLLSGITPSTVLCLTYTNAAASEMKERILSKLGSWVIAQEESLYAELNNIIHSPNQEVLKRARSLFFDISERPDSLNIQTIHGFCQSVLRRFPLEAGISPYFTVIDEEQATTLTEQAFEQCIREVQQGKRPELAPYIDAIVTELSDMYFRRFIQDAINDTGRWRHWMQQAGGLERCAAKLADFLTLPASPNTQHTYVLDDNRKQQLATLHDFLRLQKPKVLQQLADEIHAILSLGEITQRDMEDYVAAWLTQKHEPRQPIRKLVEEGGPQAERMEQELQQVQQYRYQKAQLASYTLTRNLYHVLHAIFDIYEAICHTRGYLDYHHLLHKTQAFLTRDEHSLGWVMFKLDGGIDHVLVDEAQDTNPLQWRIIKAITAEYFSGKSRKDTNRTMFIVGDEKQSIFGFQEANLDYYRSVKQWLKESAAIAQQPFYEHQLLMSYRSTPAVIKAVNSVTNALQLGEPHQAKRTQHGVVEIWPLAEASEEGGHITTAPQTLAIELANHISHWLSCGQLQPDDVMLLVRKRSGLSVQLASELRRRNIPVQGVERMALKESLAVQDVLALMQWCLLPMDDYSLACVLRSPLMNITEEQLFTLSHQRGENSLWQQLQQEATSLELTQQLAQLTRALSRVHTHSIHAFIYALLYEDAQLNAFIKRMGREVTIILGALLEKAKQFEQTHPSHYQYFIEYIRSQQHETTSKEAIQNCVRIMTVHGSKGLEAPVVILADSTSTSSSISGFEWLEYQGESVPCWLPPKGDRSPKLDEHIAATEATSAAEERRLLYVAMTRARDELYIAGSQPRTQKSGHWYEILSQTLDETSSSA